MFYFRHFTAVFRNGGHINSVAHSFHYCSLTLNSLIWSNFYLTSVWSIIIIRHCRELTTRQLFCYKPLILKYMDLVGIKVVVSLNVTSCSLVDGNQKHEWFCCAHLLSWWGRQPVSATKHLPPRESEIFYSNFIILSLAECKTSINSNL